VWTDLEPKIAGKVLISGLSWTGRKFLYCGDGSQRIDDNPPTNRNAKRPKPMMEGLPKFICGQFLQREQNESFGSVRHWTAAHCPTTHGLGLAAIALPRKCRQCLA